MMTRGRMNERIEIALDVRNPVDVVFEFFHFIQIMFLNQINVLVIR